MPILFLNFSQHVIGTGPFVLNKWKKDVKLILNRNINYFEKDSSANSLPYLDAVSVTFIKDRNQEYINFKSGKLDMISGLDQDGEVDSLASTPWTLWKMTGWREPCPSTEQLGH